MSAWDYAQCAYEMIERAYLLDACPFCRARLDQLDPDIDDGRIGYFTEVCVGICQICGWWSARGETRERIDHYMTAVYEHGSYMCWRAVLYEQIGKHRQNVIALEPTLDMDRQALPAMLVDHRQHPERLAVMGAIRDEVIAPDMTTIAWAQPHA